ncbi:MAG: hypothetical protein GF350_01935 [Chitinivibrionales bacterium]|nr:hypothetical protein [Chitinivibrionales bacterium]
MMTIQPAFMGTAIGSVPFSDPDWAVSIALESVPDAPFWPQLPRLGLNEQMEIQYSEGIPRATIDPEKGRMYFDTSGDYSEQFGEFYEQYMLAMDPDDGNGDCSAMAISEDYSKGIYALEKRLQTMDKKPRFVKVQTTGPCSFALTLVDENKRAIYYNEEFRDVIIKALSMKCRWQIQKFAPYADKVICFIDEPILSAFGSSTYVSVKRQDVVEHLHEVIESVHAENALAGIHCCGNTEWSICIDAGVDIVNFDAYEYGETIAMYPDAVKSHLEKGGMLAWGVVPTSPEIRDHTPDSMVEQLEKGMGNLAAKGIDKELLAKQAFITPSCGTGSMEPADAEAVFSMLAGLPGILKEKYGF